MFHMDLKDAMEYICRDSIGVNLTRILNRAGLTAPEQESVLEDIGERGQGEVPVPYARLEKIKEKLWHSEIFLEAVIRHSREAVPALTGYLTQEGLMEETKAALVDSGWVGSMQKTLNRTLKSMGRKEALEGYYWGIYELPPHVIRQQYHCYYFSPEGQIREKVNFNNNLFEAIFSAPHGMTLGYKERDGVYIPVYDRLRPERKQEMEETEEILMRYTRQAAEQTKDLRSIDCRKERKAMKKLLRLFMGNPICEEAEKYGSMVFCDDVLEYGSRQVAERLNEKDLKDNHVINKTLVMLGIRKKEIKESAWYEGSAVRFGKHPGCHLIQYNVYKYLLYMRQMYMWRKCNVRKKEG